MLPLSKSLHTVNDFTALLSPTLSTAGNSTSLHLQPASQITWPLHLRMHVLTGSKQFIKDTSDSPGGILAISREHE